MGRFAVMTMTDAAASRVRDIMSANPDALGVRSGRQERAAAPGWNTISNWRKKRSRLKTWFEHEGAKVFVAPDAVLYLLGTQMDFEQTTLRTGFTFQNPNQTSACGCGESVELTPAPASALNG